jgi:hypothetical protein
MGCLPVAKLGGAQNKASTHPATIHRPRHFARRICRIHLQPPATTCLLRRQLHTRRNGNRDDTTTSRKTSTSSSPARKAVAPASSSRIKVFAMNTVSSLSAASSRRLSLRRNSPHPNAPLYDHPSAHHSASKQMVTTLR